MHNERKQTNRNVEKSRDTRSKPATNNTRDAKHERPLDWDARDLKADTWLRKSPRSTQGRYTKRFWE